MDYYQRHELRKINHENNEYVIVFHLSDQFSEFAEELGRVPKEKTDIISAAKQLIKDQYPTIKVSIVKVMIGGMVVIAIPLNGENKASAQTGEPAPSTAQDSQSSTYTYQVSSGDTLWNLSRKFNTSIDNIKRANILASDILQINQPLIIPKAFHTVATGDYLSVLAKRYGTTVAAIKEVNGLKSDATQLGQQLIIPAIIETLGNEPAPNVSHPAQTTSYAVVSGDSLSVIAKRFGTSVDALKNTNNLTSDMIFVGQKLTIPMVSTNEPPKTPVETSTSYVVVSGDSLSVIAKRFNVTVDHIKQTNQLTSDMIRIGQVLMITNTTQPPKNVEPTPSTVAGLETAQKNLQTLGYYTVQTMTGNYDPATTQAIKNFQADYGLPATGKVDEATNTAIDHAMVKKDLLKDTRNYLGVPYKWGGMTPSGFDCSGFVYYMFNQNGVKMARNTSAGLYTMGTVVERVKLQPGDLVFFAVNQPGTISHVGFYMGNNQFISATSSKGIDVVSLDNSYWKKYYVGAKRVY